MRVKVTQEKFKLITIYLGPNGNSLYRGFGIFREIEIEGVTTLTNSQHAKKWQVRQRTKYYGQNGIFLNIKLTIRDILKLRPLGPVKFFDGIM